MGWMRTDYRFPDNGSVLFILHRQLLMHTELMDEMKTGGDPRKIQILVLALIRMYRPNLFPNAQILYMDFEYDAFCFKFGVYHSSLPEVQPGCIPKKMWLDPKMEQESPYEERFGRVPTPQGTSGEVQGETGAGGGGSQPAEEPNL